MILFLDLTIIFHNDIVEFYYPNNPNNQHLIRYSEKDKTKSIKKSKKIIDLLVLHNFRSHNNIPLY